MPLSVRQLLRTLPLALAAGLTLWSACAEEDERFVIPDRSPLDIWRDDITFVDATGLPQAQIDRFVAANDIDTTVTASGLVYEMLVEGEGEHPESGADLTVNYRGYIVNGIIFDQTTVNQVDDENRRTFPLDAPANQGRLIEAWEEGIPLMRRGGMMWMVVRPSLAYGASGNPEVRIRPGDVIVFEIQLVDFENP